MNLRPSLITCAGLLLAACAATGPAPVETPPEYDRAPSYPHWSGKAVSWSKLGDIEDWLAGNGPEQYPEYVPRAELELAEGRLELTGREGKELAPGVLAQRLRTAEAGFKKVLAEPRLDAPLRARAEHGLARVSELRDGPSPSPAPSKSVASAAPPSSLPIQPRESWNAAPANTARLTPGGPWTRITVHHSAKDSHDIGPFSANNVAGTIKDIQTVHMRDSGWGDIGYHFLIDPTGRIWQGRSLEWQGAHAGGPDGVNNIGNIGICLLGNFDHERPDPRALASLQKLVDGLCERHHIAASHVYGHGELKKTDCPGDALQAWVSHYASGATH